MVFYTLFYPQNFQVFLLFFDQTFWTGANTSHVYAIGNCTIFLQYKLCSTYKPEYVDPKILCPAKTVHVPKQKSLWMGVGVHVANPQLDLLRSRKAFQCWFGLHQNLGAGILSLGLYV
jgi:hypothetical protein